MARENNPIVDALGSALIGAGFKKKSDTWYCDEEDAIAVVNVQKSQYGQQYYVNLGVWFKSFGINLMPKENQCHIRFRLSSVVPDDANAKLSNALDLDAPLDADERRSALVAIFEQYGLTVLRRCVSFDGVRGALLDGSLSKALVQSKLRMLLEETKGA